ncbi:MAG: cobyrinate a,c-diamide synthase [Desulfonatronovibrionaceae bacterium]
MPKNNLLTFPRLILAGLKGGSGKTIVSLALCRLFSDRGIKIKPFKKGPDYIDARWLSAAAGSSATNLDPFLFSSSKVKSLFWSFAHDYELAVIEGNRGLFDGKDLEGSFSTAELSRMLKCPVVLVMDCTKVTRTAAALVMGCRMFEKDLNLAGVILNQTAGSRHRTITRQAVEKYTDVPVLGALPRLKQNPIPERHMGLVSDDDFHREQDIFQVICRHVSENADLSRILETARSAPDSKDSHSQVFRAPAAVVNTRPTIGVIRDKALWFYYLENLEALKRSGAELVDLSLISRQKWPEIHGLYLGGGFPETMARALDENILLKEKLFRLAEMGMPVYAECGGFMYLAQSLEYEDRCFAMAGILPVRTRLYPRPQGHGYVQARVVRKNPFFPVGDVIFGHEFHYSRCLELPEGLNFCFQLDRGVGIDHGLDGISFRNVLAGYTHIHALGAENWAQNFVRAASIYQDALSGSSRSCPDIVC